MKAQPDAPSAARAGSGAGLVAAALASSANLDFPQVTEICERLEAEPRDVPEAVQLLASVLCDRQAHPRATLRALTISHEMMYSASAVAAFRSADGLREALAALRGVRDAELGAVTGGNVRMLATEMEKVCFASDDAESRSTVSNAELLERARQRAGRTFDSVRRKAERALDKTAVYGSSAMQKAERAVERTANMVMQEAERTWVGTFAEPQASTASTASAEERQRQQRRREKDMATLEEEQLQWALNASLRESRGQAASPPPRLMQPARQREQPAPQSAGDGISAVLQGPTEEVLSQIQEAEARAQRAERALAVQATHSAAAARGDEHLVLELQSSDSLAAGLRERQAQVSAEMAQVDARRLRLEAQLAGLQGGAALERRLRAWVAHLEAAVERAASEGPAPAPSPAPAQVEELTAPVPRAAAAD